MPLGSTAAASAGDAWIHKRIIDLDSPSYLAQQLQQWKFQIKKLKISWKKANLWENLIYGVSKTIENEVKEQKGGSLSMFLGTLVASLLANLLAAKRYN